MTFIPAGGLADRTSRPADASRHARGDARSPSAALLAFCLLAICVGCAAAVAFWLRRDSLWEDEIIAVTHAAQPLPSFFIELLRNDIHPPLYFLQLAGWLALGPDTDRWALTNSLIGAGASLATVFGVTRALHGSRSAWIATALFAVLPAFAWSAGTLRMYAVLPAAILLVYYANRRWFESGEARWLVAAVAVAILTAYLHAVEFYFVAFVLLAALIEAVQAAKRKPAAERSARSIPFWFVGQLILALCVLPLAASALTRGSDAAAADSASTMLTTGGALIAGWKASGLPVVRLVGTVLFVALVGAGLVESGTRWRTLVIPVGAVVVALLIAMVFKPIYKQPVFAANLLPFVVLGAAAAAARSRSIACLVFACIVVLGAAACPLSERQAQAAGYAAAAIDLRSLAVPGDVVVVPNVSVYWGIARYAIGSHWGRPLAVMPAPNEDWTRLNRRIDRFFGDGTAERMGLVPESDFVESAGVRYVLDGDAVAATRDANRVWMVTRERYRQDADLGPPWVPSRSFATRTYGDGELLVCRFDRSEVR